MTLDTMSKAVVEAVPLFLGELHKSLLNNGFSADQAFDIVKTHYAAMLSEHGALLQYLMGVNMKLLDSTVHAGK